MLIKCERVEQKVNLTKPRNPEPLDEYLLMVVSTLLLKRLHVFRFNLDRET